MVGALNVGSIKLNFEQEIKTNVPKKSNYFISEY